ncbi:hypothetical protein RclHR1_00230023 [Rhizophagus clarus]|uniref:Transmembrane protein n=1 Tax=Rhizophagus clarus TaxID=94130 RepID=A0A2Z6QX72_9GLOM|nr:hypothetical protein RclHR1_00230023 [Rhizophagus clarus]GES72927.1 hypothetical protein GLOIN_2v1727228 [Rhizophagus clarus]
MKSFSFFVFLNVLILFAHAQNQTTTCEQFNLLNGTATCTPCQQAIFKTNQLPISKCNVVGILFGHALGATGPDSLRDDIDKTCAETADACSESDAKSAYTEVDKACNTELNQYFSATPPYNNEASIGSDAALTILVNYMAIPFRESLCFKVGGEYCLVKSYEQTNQSAITQSTNATNLFQLDQCDDCTQQSYNNLKNFQLSHPLNTPNLKKIMTDITTKQIQTFEQNCPNLKSDAQKLATQFYNYSVVILIGLIGFIYVNFI